MIVIFLQCSFKLCMLTELWTLIYTVQRHSSTRSYISCPGRATTPRSVQISRQTVIWNQLYMWPFLFCNFFIDELFQASGKIGDLISALDRFEPRSSYLYYHMAQIFSRIVSWYINFDKYNYIWFCNITMHRVLYQYVSRWSQRPLIVKPILDSVLALSLYKVTSILLQSVF